jgi:hypothetical protein
MTGFSAKRCDTNQHGQLRSVFKNGLQRVYSNVIDFLMLQLAQLRTLLDQHRVTGVRGASSSQLCFRIACCGINLVAAAQADCAALFSRFLLMRY